MEELMQYINAVRHLFHNKSRDVASHPDLKNKL